MLKKAFKIVALPVVLSAFLVACGDEEDRTVATVNGEKIADSELITELKQTYGLDVLDTLIANKIVELEAKKLKLSVTDKEIQEEYNNYAEQYGGKDALIEALKSYNMSKEDIQADIKDYLLTKKVMADYVDIKDEDIETYFNENKDLYVQSEQVEASHILVENEATAKELLTKIHDGENFAKLAKENSIDEASAKNGGALGFFGRGEMDSEFEDAAFAAKVGDIVGPIKTKEGYHIIKITDKQEAYEPSFEDVKDLVQADVLDAKIDENYQSWLEDKYQEYDITSTLFESPTPTNTHTHSH